MKIGERVGATKTMFGGPLPSWPPLLATEGEGGRSLSHRHHAMHVVLCRKGTLRVRIDAGRYSERASGAIVAADVTHSIDAEGCSYLLTFVDPESRAGVALRAVLSGPLCLLTAAQVRGLLDGVNPSVVMGERGDEWLTRVVAAVGGELAGAPPALHPRVRKLLRVLRERGPEADDSLEALAAAVGLSPSRMMHAFTESIGLPIRPYLAWLRVQRAASAIVQGAPLAQAAVAAGFADAAHMTRTFRRMLGATPSSLRPVSDGRTQ